MRPSFSKAVLVTLIATSLGFCACKAKPTKADEAKAKPTPTATISESDATAEKELAPERFTLPEVNQILLKLKACVDEDSSLEHMAKCGCLSDLSLSNESQPEDVEAYCSDFAARTVASSKLSEEEQMRQEYLLAASDVPAPASTGIFSFAAPCMMNAFKKKSKAHHNLCVCAAHALANGMADYNPKTNEEVVEAMGKVGKQMQESKVCQ